MSVGKKNGDRIRQLFNKQRGLCCYCRCNMTLKRDLPHSATVEHVIPKSIGGTLEKGNVRAACWKCNTERGSSMGLPENLRPINKALP
jgi:5-methylcytosine-specific restriction endonuclease McrA